MKKTFIRITIGEDEGYAQANDAISAKSSQNDVSRTSGCHRSFEYSQFDFMMVIAVPLLVYSQFKRKSTFRFIKFCARGEQLKNKFHRSDHHQSLESPRLDTLAVFAFYDSCLFILKPLHQESIKGSWLVKFSARDHQSHQISAERLRNTLEVPGTIHAEAHYNPSFVCVSYDIWRPAFFCLKKKLPNENEQNGEDIVGVFLIDFWPTIESRRINQFQEYYLIFRFPEMYLYKGGSLYLIISGR